MIQFLPNPIPNLRDLGAVSTRKLAAVAYITTDHLQLGSGDVLVCDASKRAIQWRMTSRDLLAKLVAKGVSVYSCDSLHAKLVVFDDKRLFAGSANLSKFAEQHVECGLLTDDVEAVADAAKFITELADVADRVNDEFIKSIFQLTLKPATPAATGKAVRNLKRKRKRGQLDVNYWFFKATRELSPRAQKVADRLWKNWKDEVDVDIRVWKRERELQGASPGDFFVCSQSKNSFGHRLDRRNVRRRFITACHCLGEERQGTITIHSGRHSFCSHALNGGRTLAEVRDAAGHRSVGTTSSYLHTVEDDDTIGDLFAVN